MTKSFSLRSGTDRFSPWLAALLGIVAIKAVLSLSVKSTPFVYSYSGISYLLLLILATWFSIQNAGRRTLRGRPFWLLVAAGCGVWAFHQFLDLYYELGLHIEVPAHSMADEILFFHLVPFMAAAATLPNLHTHEVKQHRWILNTLLIVGLWAFLYGFTVAPYKYIQLSPSDNGARFDVLYLVENLALILTLAVVALRAKPPWKMIYLHLLCASTLYALSSTVANLAIDAGGYINGKLYGFGLTASVCWFVWLPLSGRAVPESESDALPPDVRQDSKVSAWAMLAVVMISLPMAWELFHRDENADIRTLRLIVATGAIVLLAGGAYLKEYLDRRELAWSFNRRLIQAQEEERIRISRELHDDLCQRMALLSIRLGQLKALPGGLPEEVHNQLSKMQNDAAEMSLSIQQVSHELHSSTLEILGLSGAARSWCGELSEKRKIEISFGNHDVPTLLPSEISLNLFRVLQEALNNAAKYSGATCFDVRLWGTSAEIHLTVADRGKGFDIGAAMKGQGLGLKSMRERVKLMNGRLTIRSKPNRGTMIHARVPVVSVHEFSHGIPSA